MIRDIATESEVPTNVLGNSAANDQSYGLDETNTSGLESRECSISD
jgi:hypothetical protein